MPRAASAESASVLAKRHGGSEAIAYKWKFRTSVHDRSHTAHHLHITLTGAQEEIVVYLRKQPVAAFGRPAGGDTRIHLPQCVAFRAGSLLAPPRCRQPARYQPVTEKQPHKSFKAYEPGYLPMYVKYLPQMADQTQRSYLLMAIDRATRWVFVAIKKNKTAASAKGFLKAVHKACPFKKFQAAH